eukprot:XP_001701735.1 predicted protein [Chlamydomonas reinhardtii]
MVLMAWAALIVLLPCWGLRSAEGQPTSTDSGMSTIRKNILLILTDDQDYLLGSADAKYMPTLDKYLRKQGLELPQFIVAGCPSRASLLTGRHCHNTNITSNSAARGGAFQFLERGLDSDYLPVWLQAAGYNTYLVGQFLNGFNRSVLQQYGCPQGWTAADVLVPAYGCAGPDGVVTYTGRYHEELIREKVTKRIDEAAGQDQPFFMMVATVAPRDSGRAATAYPEVMPEYKNLFLGERAPRLADWGVPVPAEVGFTSQRTNNFNAADIDARFRARLQALRAVDDTLALMLSRLACHDLLDDTVIVFSSDSGFKLGSHNMAQDKSTYFEEDVRVPMLLAGPGMPVGVYAAEVTAAAVDLTATITYLAGIMSEPGSTTLDGAPLPLDAIAAAYPQPNQPRASTRRPPRPPPPPPPVNLTASVEQQNSTAESGRRLLAQVLGLGEGEWAAEEAGRRARLQQQQQAAQGSAREPLPYYGMWSNVRTLESWLDMATPSRASKSFRAVRACSSFMGYGPPVLVPRAGNTTCFKYIVFCNPANVDSLGTIRMLFDLGRDPTELVNLYKQPLDGLALRLVDRLDALLSVTAYCEGGLCRNPFRAIHIDGSINNLYQAMDPTFDLLYASFDKFSYRRCAP